MIYWLGNVCHYSTYYNIYTNCVEISYTANQSLVDASKIITALNLGYQRSVSFASSLPGINVLLTSDVSLSSYSLDSQGLPLIKACTLPERMAQDNPSILLHEFGHFIWDKCFNNSFPPVYLHGINQPCSTTLAFSEGWANFFSCYARNNTSYYEYGAYDWGGYNIETLWISTKSYPNGWADPIPSRPGGSNYEMFISAALWDIYDNSSSNEPWDCYNGGDSYIFHIMKWASNTTITDFTNNWHDLYALDNIYSICDHHGINMPNAFSVYAGPITKSNAVSDYLTGGAAVEMMLNYLSFSSPGISSIYTQSLANYPNGMTSTNVRDVLRTLADNSNINKHYSWDQFDGDQNTVLEGIIKWVTYHYTNVVAPRSQSPEWVPALVPLSGDYYHWALINGCVTDIDPWNNSNYYNPNWVVYGVWFTCPSGQNYQTMGNGTVFCDINNFFTNYFKPIGGQYHAVVDPPLGAAPKFKIGNAIILNSNSNISEELSNKLQGFFAKNESMNTILKTKTVNSEYVITDIDNKSDYTIVAYGKNNNMQLGAVVDNTTHKVLELCILDKPIEYSIISKEDAKNVLKNKNLIKDEDLLQINGRLVYSKDYCSNKYYPLWEINTSSHSYYINGKKEVQFDKLKDANHSNMESSTIIGQLESYPNPFNPAILIKYSLPTEEYVSLIVYNVLGQVVAKLVDEVKPSGTYQVSFNARNLTSGIYIARIQAGNLIKSIKLQLIK